MLSSTTPFKIHDENGGVSAVKGVTAKKTFGGGLGGDKGAMKSVMKSGKGLNLSTKTPLGAKSSRRALGDLSSSQVNTQNRLAVNGFGNASSMKSGNGNTKSAKNKLSFQLAFDENLEVEQPSKSKIDSSQFICSQIGAEEDVYDTVMRKASKIDVVLAPMSGVDVNDGQGGESALEFADYNFAQENQEQWKGASDDIDYNSCAYEENPYSDFTLDHEEPPTI